MPTKIDKPVQVLAWCDGHTGKMVPKLVRWVGSDYQVKEIGFLHPFREGRDFVHVFTMKVALKDGPECWPGPQDMLLHFYSVSWIWKLIETSDADFR